MSDDRADADLESNDEKKLDYALDLMRRMRPQTIETDLQSLIDLVPELTESLLNAIDQPLKIARDRSVGKDYLLCDYNRDGDSYRSPWSSVYDPPFDDGIQPSERLRRLEIETNAAFEQYRELYFEGGYSSVYFWETPGRIAGVVLIKKTNDLGGEWDSVHVLEINENK